MNSFTVRRWMELLRAAGVQQDSKQLFIEIERRYSEPHRAYHNLLHIDECLQELDRVSGAAQNALALELAIWFHDVIYDPRASDNEKQSARLASEWLKEASNEFVNHISKLILSTKSHEPGDIEDASLLVDIDLSILGKPPERFSQFESGIRSEYAWVPADVYRQKRAEILEGFMKRERIYFTKYFRERYEEAARRNLAKLIAELKCVT